MALKISSHHCGAERNAGQGWLAVWCEVCDSCRQSVAVSTLHYYAQLTGSLLTNGATKKVVQYHIFSLGQKGIWEIQAMLKHIHFRLITSVGSRDW